jgi:hypothetical protein
MSIFGDIWDSVFGSSDVCGSESSSPASDSFIDTGSSMFSSDDSASVGFIDTGSVFDSSSDYWHGDAFGTAPDWSAGNDSWESSTGTDGYSGGPSIDSFSDW